MFLQTQISQVSQATNSLFQYGVLGLFAIILLWTVWYLEKQRKEREKDMIDERESLKQRIIVLENRFDEYQKVDRTRMENLIQANIEVMNDVKELLERK